MPNQDRFEKTIDEITMRYNLSTFGFAEQINFRGELIEALRTQASHYEARIKSLEAQVDDLKETNKLLAQQGDKDFHDRVRLEALLEEAIEILLEAEKIVDWATTNGDELHEKMKSCIQKLNSVKNEKDAEKESHDHQAKA